MKSTGLPVAVTMCIGPNGDHSGVASGDCAVKLARAGISGGGVSCNAHAYAFDRILKHSPNVFKLEIQDGVHNGGERAAVPPPLWTRPSFIQKSTSSPNYLI